MLRREFALFVKVEIEEKIQRSIMAGIMVNFITSRVYHIRTFTTFLWI